MNIVSNDKLIIRNKRIGQAAMIGGLAVLAGGMLISVQYPDRFEISAGALLLGFVLSQVGIHFSNRWGRSPRPDELLSNGLKGLDSRYTLYHYTTPTPHLLVGPSGVWVLMPRHQRGEISYSNNRWHQKGGNLYLKIFAQEGLGRPDLEVKSEIELIQKFMSKVLPTGETAPEIRAALIFTHPKTEINIDADEQPPAETLLLKDIKDVLRKNAKGKGISEVKARMIQDAIRTA